MITSEDLDIIRESIFLDLLLTKLEKDKSILIKSPIKIIRPYLFLIEDVMIRVTKDISSLNKLIRKRGIKILDPHLMEKQIKVQFLCRGYQDDIVLQWEFVRAELEVRLNRYFNLTENK
ncbi:hypothetical protein ACFVS2_20160 [Brevibacillus sp. NPDC058079]|uniref:hypothetical protein n=1 Tax=Brevibacillus sp. NPDC058079 TaxID=3346330 RepID=UPI0036EF9E2B